MLGGYVRKPNSSVPTLLNFHIPGWKTNAGDEFIFGFMPNYPNAIQFLRIFVTTKMENDVNVIITTPIFDAVFHRKLVARKGQIQEVTMNNELAEFSSGVENKGIYIKADEEIIVYASNARENSMDAFLVLPSATIGLVYYVVAWSEKSSFLIVAKEDYTDVNITLGKNSQNISLAGIIIGPGESVSVKLNKFQSLFIQSSVGDFTGTCIKGTKPFTVLSGSICATVKQGSCDHLAEQMLPIEQWEKEFVTVGMPGCISSDTFRVVASLDNTTVNVSGIGLQTLQNSGDFFDFTVSNLVSKTVSADKPIALFLFSSGNCGSPSNGDPSMVLIPALRQFSSNYTFSTNSSDKNSLFSFIAIVIEDKYIKGLLFDGSNLPKMIWRSVEGRPDLMYTEFNITADVHTISHVDSYVKYMALSTGTANFISYGYPLGLELLSNESVCIFLT